MWCLQVKYKDTERQKGKDVKKFSMQAFIKKAHKIIQYKVDFNARSITRDKEYFIKIQQR